jgi:hypothetical protein
MQKCTLINMHKKSNKEYGNNIVKLREKFHKHLRSVKKNYIIYSFF